MIRVGRASVEVLAVLRLASPSMMETRAQGISVLVRPSLTTAVAVWPNEPMFSYVSAVTADRVLVVLPGCLVPELEPFPPPVFVGDGCSPSPLSRTRIQRLGEGGD